MPDAFDLNLRHLLALPVIARTGAVTAACRAVHLSQPALTQGLAKIEASLGARLFDREPQGVRSTLAGALFVRRVEQASEHLAEGVRALSHGAALWPRLTMSQLRALVSVAEHGNFTLAARSRGLAQPSVHRAARELEQAAGEPLFLRTGRGIRLTPAAERFARRARLALAELRAGEDEIADLGRTGAGRVAIGAMPLARAVRIPRAVQRFRLAFPAGQVRLVDGPYPELLAGLRAGDIDLLVGAERDPAPAGDIVQIPLFEDRPVIVGRRGHPLAGREASAADLARFPWVIARSGAPLRDQWEAMFTSAGQAPPLPAAECSSTMVIRGLLLNGDWLTLLSPEQIAVEREAGLVVELGPLAPQAPRRIALTLRRDWRPTRAQAAMIELLKDRAAQEIE